MKQGSDKVETAGAKNKAVDIVQKRTELNDYPKRRFAPRALQKSFVLYIRTCYCREKMILLSPELDGCYYLDRRKLLQLSLWNYI